MPKNQITLLSVAQRHETFGIWQFLAEKVVFESKMFGPAMAGWASKMAITRSAHIEIGRNTERRMHINKLFVFVLKKMRQKST